ncbi:ABC transporter permease [Cryomorphaceae bacterium 1068]|nr:ABC transporter permease [Cryomorphaceae bacterium 1068]
MTNYILKKIGYGLLVLWGVVTLVFAIFSINPGDPAAMLLGQRADEEAIERVRRELALDLPWGKQYALYMNDISPLSLHNEVPESRVYLDESKYNFVQLVDFGETVLVLKSPYLRRSYQSKKQVSEIIAEALPGTVVLAVGAIFFALFFGILLGVVTAVYKGRFIDGFSLFSAVLGMSAPSFFSAIIISWIGGYLWSVQTTLPAIPIVLALIGLGISLTRKPRSWIKSVEWLIKGALLGVVLLVVNSLTVLLFDFNFLLFRDAALTLPGTGLGMTGSLYDVDVFTGEYLALGNLILPMITLGIRPLAIVVQLTRNALLEELSKDYTRTARAKGLSPNAVVFKHALRNALNPVVTAVSGWFASMLAGAVFVEFVFNWKGLGLQVFQSLQNDDFPVVMGSVLVIAASFVVINIFVDIIYGLLDPRVRIG